MRLAGPKFDGKTVMIRANDLTNSMCIWVAALHLLVSTMMVVGPAQAQAQDGPPVIDLQIVETGSLGDSQVFSATVTDNDQVANVELYFRLAGESAYGNTPMLAIPGTSIFTVTLDIKTAEETAIEYYVSASDSAGNRSVTGFAFDPLVRVLMPSEPLADATDPVLSAQTASEPVTAPSTSGISTGRKILYGALAVIAVGAIAVAVSGGGDGGGGGATDTPGGPVVPVTITVDTIASEFD